MSPALKPPEVRGDPLKLSFNPDYFRAALGMGFRSFRLHGAESPLVGEGQGETYLWMPYADEASPHSQSRVPISCCCEAGYAVNRLLATPKTRPNAYFRPVLAIYVRSIYGLQTPLWYNRNRQRAKTMAAKKRRDGEAKPYATPLEYLTDLIEWLHTLVRYRLAQRKAVKGEAADGKAEEAMDAPEDVNGVPKGKLERLAMRRAAVCSYRWHELNWRTEATLAEGKTDLPLERLAAEHGLDKNEKLILGLATALALDPTLEDAVSELAHQCNAESVRAYMTVLGETAEERIRMRRYFISSGKLVSCGLISMTHYTGMMSEADFYSMTVELPRRVSSIILGEFDIEDQVAGFCSLVEPQVSLEQVVLPQEQKDEVLRLVSKREEFLRLREAWGFDKAISYGRGTIIMFSGAPGTGKTMLAHALAKETGHRLLLGDLRKAVGGRTGAIEDNIALMFQEARLMQAILFFDEADEMFVDRAANGLMPMLLREFEKMDGVAILATNRKQVLDEALERRILYKLDFEPPTSKLRERIWRVHLPAEAPIADDVDPKALAERYHLSGGLIKNAVLRAACEAAFRGSEITQEMLERCADQEEPARESGKVGFKAVG